MKLRSNWLLPVRSRKSFPRVKISAVTVTGHSYHVDCCFSSQLTAGSYKIIRTESFWAVNYCEMKRPSRGADKSVPTPPEMRTLVSRKTGSSILVPELQ